MSYSFDVKKKLLSVNDASCCRKAELYGFLLFSNTVSDEEIRLVTAYPEFRSRYLSFLMEAGVRKFELACQGNMAKKYVCRITHPRDLRLLREYLGGISFSKQHVRPPILTRTPLRRSLLRRICRCAGRLLASHFSRRSAKPGAKRPSLFRE